jgi:glycosyl transferase family 25
MQNTQLIRHIKLRQQRQQQQRDKIILEANNINMNEIMELDKDYEITEKNKLNNVYYINLEKRTDKNEDIKKVLEPICNEYTRFNAIEKEKGYVGCSLSHLAVLNIAIDKNLDYIVICEDDFQIMNNKYLLKHINLIKDNFDWDVIVLCSYNSNYINTKYDNIKNVLSSQTTTAYIVNNKYYKTLQDNFKEGIKNLLITDRKAQFAIDIYWKRLQDVHKWFGIFPSYCFQKSGYSDIEKRNVKYGISH